jgi:hypothetical protein
MKSKMALKLILSANKHWIITLSIEARISISISRFSNIKQIFVTKLL